MGEDLDLVLSDEEKQLIVAARQKRENKAAREKAAEIIKPAKESLANAKKALEDYIANDSTMAALQGEINSAKATLEAVYAEHPELKTIRRAGGGGGGTRKTGSVVVTSKEDGTTSEFKSLNGAWKAVRGEEDVKAIPWSRAEACFGSKGYTVELKPQEEAPVDIEPEDEGEEG